MIPGADACEYTPVLLYSLVDMCRWREHRGYGGRGERGEGEEGRGGGRGINLCKMYNNLDPPKFKKRFSPDNFSSLQNRYQTLTNTHSVSTLAGGLSGSQLAPTSCDITVRSEEVELEDGLKFWLAM